jgi:hypothetical protein
MPTAVKVESGFTLVGADLDRRLKDEGAIGTSRASCRSRCSTTLEDIRSRARRRDYLAALDDMFALTLTAGAPWYAVSSGI